MTLDKLTDVLTKAESTSATLPGGPSPRPASNGVVRYAVKANDRLSLREFDEELSLRQVT